MTDPDRPEVVHHTTINNPPRQGGGNSWLGFVIGGLVVIVAIIGFVLWSGGAPSVPDKVADIDVDVDIPAPRMPDAPTLPPVEPPTVPTPAPAPAPVG